MKKFLSFIASLVLCLGLATSAFAEGAAPVASEQLDAVETALYGTHQSSSMMERMESLEDDIYGAPDANRNILDRIQSAYDYVCGTNGGNGSFLQKLNAVDSRFNAQITSGPAKTRIEDLENTIYGQAQGGSLNQRLDRLVETAYAGGQVPVESVVLPKDSLVKIEFTSPLSSKTARTGDPVSFKVADNLYVNDVLVLSKGATGVAEVAKVVQPRSFGRDARIDVKFSHVFAVDGNQVPIYIGKLAKQEAKTAAGAAGATIGGMIVLGPIGAIGGAFVTGQSIVIPEGSTTYVQVVQDQTISGIVYQEAAAASPNE
ncbi:MAG: hypothetical protein IJ181_07990 [Acidaminococcaceae bacterium]|nr:hypothetical protein [Acidaminococcaceae bacterium]